jgi:predicted Na+-dependent transporter
MFVLGQQIVMSNNVKITIPYADSVFSLIGMTIPLAIRLLIQKHRPDWAQRSIKLICLITIIFLILILEGGLFVNLHLLRLLNRKIIAAGMSFAWTRYIFGALAAFLAKLTRLEIIAVSIETALKNPGIAYVLLQLSLPEPESDFAATPLIGQIMMTGPPLWIIYLIFIIAQKLKNKHKIIKDKSFYDENSGVTKEMLPSI